MDYHGLLWTIMDYSGLSCLRFRRNVKDNT